MKKWIATVFAVLTISILLYTATCLASENIGEVIAEGDEYYFCHIHEASFSESVEKYGIYNFITEEWEIEPKKLPGNPMYMDDFVSYMGEGVFHYENIGLMDSTDIFLSVPLGDYFELNFYSLSRDAAFWGGYCYGFLYLGNGRDSLVAFDVYGNVDDAGISGRYGGSFCNVYQNDLGFAYLINNWDKYNLVFYIYDTRSVIEIPSLYAERVVVDYTDYWLTKDHVELLWLVGEDGVDYYAAFDLQGNLLVGPDLMDNYSEDNIRDLVGEETPDHNGILLTSLAPAYSRATLNPSDATDNLGNEYHNCYSAGDIERSITYELDGKYSLLDGIVAVTHTKQGGQNGCWIEIAGDGQVLWRDDTLTGGMKPYAMSVDVTDMQMLTITMRGVGTSIGWTSLTVILADARLYSDVSQDDWEAEIRDQRLPERNLPEGSVRVRDLTPYLGELDQVEFSYGDEGESAEFTGFFKEANAIYDIGAKYDTLSFIAAVTDEEQNRTGKKGYIRIYGDGIPLWIKEDMDIDTQPMEVAVDVTGVTDLQIQMTGIEFNALGNGMCVLLDEVILSDQIS